VEMVSSHQVGQLLVKLIDIFLDFRVSKKL